MKDELKKKIKKHRDAEREFKITRNVFITSNRETEIKNKTYFSKPRSQK